MVRNPYDCIASMINRGWSVAYAVGIYLYNISMGHIRSDRFKTLRYEDLTGDPQRALNYLMHFMGLHYEPAMIEADEKIMKMNSWQYSETAAVRRGESTFAHLSDSLQMEIQYMMALLQFKKNYEFHSIRPKFKNIFEIMEEFNYDHRMTGIHEIKIARNHLRRSLYYQKILRGFKRYPIGYLNFPYELKD